MIEKDIRAKNELRVRTHGTVKFVPWLVRQIKVCGNSIYIHIRYTLSLTYCFEIHPIPNYKPSNQANCQSCNHQLPPMWFQSKKALMRNWTRRPIFHRSTQHAIQEGVTVKRASFYAWMLETPPNRLIITSIYYPDQFLGGKPENLMKLRTINWNFQNFPFAHLTLPLKAKQCQDPVTSDHFIHTEVLCVTHFEWTFPWKTFFYIDENWEQWDTMEMKMEFNLKLQTVGYDKSMEAM